MAIADCVILGSGTSVGVPFVGCDCEVCRSTNPHNKRSRAAALLRLGERRILIDCGPDFRLQALSVGVKRLDAVLITHAHADHIMGMDDLRLLTLRDAAPMPIHGLAETIESIRTIFAYAFEPQPERTFRPRFDLRVVADQDRPFEIAGQQFLPVPVEHAGLTVLGFRLGGFAYVPDVKTIPESSLDRLRGLETLVIGSLWTSGHPTHWGIEESLATVAELAPRQAWLTHLGHHFDADTCDQWLPPRVNLAYDGLVIPLAAAGLG